MPVRVIRPLPTIEDGFISIHTGGQYLLADTSHTVEVESANAIADDPQTP